METRSWLYSGQQRAQKQWAGCEHWRDFIEKLGGRQVVIGNGKKTEILPGIRHFCLKEKSTEDTLLSTHKYEQFVVFSNHAFFGRGNKCVYQHTK